uniref:Apple domain-containing protein n=1 Tax=Panagrolaimus davidi TaxID=227884 RepID=A0A914QG17_9BILA
MKLCDFALIFAAAIFAVEAFVLNSSKNGSHHQQPGLGPAQIKCDEKNRCHAPLGFLIDRSFSSSCGFWLDKNVAGADLSTKRGGIDECCNFCKVEKKCVAFSWKDVDGGTCFFKSAAEPLIKEVGTTLGMFVGE